MNIDTIQTFLGTTAIDLLMKIGAALIFWIVGRWLISKVVHLIQAGMNRNSIDPTLTKYLGSIITIALNITLVLGILGYFGIQTTSFAAMLAGAGVAIGAAWSGMLGNFAAGAFMLVLRPFKVGDFVSIGGVTGTVHELGLFGTTIITPDNVMTIVGNGKVFGDTVQNYSALPVRRVERTAQLAQGVEALIVVWLEQALVGDPQAAVENGGESVRVLIGALRCGEPEDETIWYAARQIIAREVVVALAGTPAAERDQRGEVAVAVAVLRKDDEFGAISEPEFAADKQFESNLLGGYVGAHDAGERAFVGDCQRAVAEFGGAHDQFLRVRGAAQEAEVAYAVKFGVIGEGGGHFRVEYLPNSASSSRRKPGSSRCSENLDPGLRRDDG